MNLILQTVQPPGMVIVEAAFSSGDPPVDGYQDDRQYDWATDHDQNYEEYQNSHPCLLRPRAVGSSRPAW
jgi:hypothetical protein